MSDTQSFIEVHLISAATITIFRSHGIFRAIKSLPGQNRVFGFSRSFVQPMPW